MNNVITFPSFSKWTSEKILAEARSRTRPAIASGVAAARIQQVLADLCIEAEWTEAEFIDALCEDVIRQKTLSIKKDRCFPRRWR